MDRQILGARGMFKFGKKKGAAAIDDAALPAVADGAAADGEADAAPAKKKLPLLFIVIPAALVVLGGHGGGAEGEANPALGVITDGPDGVIFYTLPDMVVNIQDPSGKPTFLKLKLTLEMHDYALAEHLQAEMPRMQDMFQGFLRELRPDDLAGSAGSFQLRAEILRRVNLIAAPGKVDAVLIEEMLVQ